MNGDVKYFNNALYYEHNGQYYPLRISSVSSGGGGGIKGILVQDEGNQVNGFVKILDFIGAGVTVTDLGNKRVGINISGDAIQSLTTAQRLALIPTTALIVEDTDLDMYFKWSTVSNAWSPF